MTYVSGKVHKSSHGKWQFDKRWASLPATANQLLVAEPKLAKETTLLKERSSVAQLQDGCPSLRAKTRRDRPGLITDPPTTSFANY